ncbi:MFS transporter [Ferrovibrio xuzhouensis]|uniref:MFS transporter n=1 Tax=Ferrovibrio xuzhouensis TaxID=1576914 RepID=A0ABV7VDY1_9PROT
MRTPSPSVAIAALSVSAFAIGTTEFVIMGLLPQLSADLGVSVPDAGLLVTGYALGVAGGAPLLAALTGRLPRRSLLLGLMALFTIGNLLCALAPGYGFLMAARIVTSLAHGSFFGVGSIVAAGLVAPDRRAKAVALMFTGLTVANILGVPLGKLLGDVAGWRATFWAVSVLGTLSVGAIALLVPQVKSPPADFRRELAVATRPGVLLALSTTIFSSAGAFAAFTYIAPLLLQVTHTTQAMVTVALLLFGVGVTVGNILGGRIADRSLMPGLMAMFAAFMLGQLALGLAAPWLLPALAAVLLFGMLCFGPVPGLQTRVLDKAKDAAALAATLNIGAFNIGNALGAWAGGMVITAGFDLRATTVLGAGFVAISLGLAWLGHSLDRARRGAGDAVVAAAPAD